MSQISPLENLSGPGKPLSKEPPDENEINGLISSGRARLHDANNSHEIRNLGEYEGDLNINARIVDDLITATESVSKALGL